MKTHYNIVNLGKVAIATAAIGFIFPNSSVAQNGSYESHNHPHDFYREVNEGGVAKLYTAHGVEASFREFSSIGVQQMISMGKGTSVKSGSGAKSASGPTFNLIFKDNLGGNGKGFDDATLGAKRKQTIEAAFNYIATMIGNTGSADILIDVSNSTIPSNTIGQFAVSRPVYTVADGFNQGHVMKHILTGTDPNVSKPDGTIEFNFNPDINYSYDYPAEPSGSQYDFYTVCLHEICHLLGFSSNIAATGTSESTTNAALFSSFDQLLRKPDGTPLIVNNVVNPASILTSNGITFELSNGGFAPVYAPSSYGGSSMDHFDNSRSSGQPFLMNPGLSRGQSVRFLSQEEAMVLQQLGYTIDIGVATSVDEEFGSQFNEKTVVGELYPNPSSKDKAVKINMSNVKEREILVIVYDILGRQAYSKVLMNDGGEGGTYTAVDPSHNLAAGMYIVVGSTKDELFNKKLIIR